jgi:hypothetical protein
LSCLVKSTFDMPFIAVFTITNLLYLPAIPPETA